MPMIQANGWDGTPDFVRIQDESRPPVISVLISATQRLYPRL